jgi:hypothetical protein
MGLSSIKNVNKSPKVNGPCRWLCPSSGSPGGHLAGDLSDMSMVGAATAAEDGQLGQFLLQPGAVSGQRTRIAAVE